MAPVRLPAFRVSPAQGRASIVFSFFRSFIDPMLSQPFVVDVVGGGAWASVSEKIAIFCFLGLDVVVAGVLVACCWLSSCAAGA